MCELRKKTVKRSTSVIGWAGMLLSAAGLVSGFARGAVAQDAPAPTEKPAETAPEAPSLEVRGTWLTTTANSAIANATNTAATMERLREIGLNTVYVEVWKNGYTQYPSQVLQRTIGLDRRPALMKSDPSDTPEQIAASGRDLLQETLIEAHRNGLIYIAWFEYGFMAAHKDTNPHLRQMKKEWFSLDQKGNEVAPNGFVWMNPLHPEARRFLLDLVLEAVDKYDLDGIQLDDRIVWPYINMGYDAYTKSVYAAEHGGKEPPEDFKDAEWIRWRANKVDEFSKMFVQEIRAKRPKLLISLSPAVYPWSYENYCLEWPKWGAWTAADGIDRGPVALPDGTPWPGKGVIPRWDEFVPQCYRFSYSAFEKTWLDQVKWMRDMGGGRVSDLYAGIRVVGEGADSTWEDLRRSMELVRSTGGGGHVHWFSRGVLDVYPKELESFYRGTTRARTPAHPYFAKLTPGEWRPGPVGMQPTGQRAPMNTEQWQIPPVRPAHYVLIGKSEGARRVIRDMDFTRGAPKTMAIPTKFTELELLLDRRPDLNKAD
jgi:uncharacterized lipoprotein YddW (UPF0748 family)